jgi:poly(hydroxyalkanoate) granule-associated protein
MATKTKTETKSKTGSKTKTKTKADTDRNLQQELRDSAHRVWLAGLGALSTVEEQGRELFQQLVDKGQVLESEGKEKFGKARTRVESEVERAKTRFESEMGKAKSRFGARAEEVGSTLEDRLTEVLHRFGVPTRDEIRDLTDRVEELNSKVDRLKTNSSRPAATAAGLKVYHVAPHDEGWKVEAEGASRATSVHSTKDEALTAGRELAKNQAPSRVVVHKKDGTFQTEYTYEDDAVTN